VKELPRAVAASISISIVVGAAVAAALVVGSEGAPVLARLSFELVIQLILISLMASILVSLPLGLLGGLFAGTMLRRHSTSMPPARWPSLGTVAGMAVGACGAAVYTLVLSGGDFSTELFGAMGFFFTAGAICGAISGLLMGLWCARQVRLRSTAA
jgi:hypothetical protein